MNTIVFTTERTGPHQLEKLHAELKGVGVESFHVDFETHEIALYCNACVSIDELSCALKRAGVRCPCYRAESMLSNNSENGDF